MREAAEKTGILSLIEGGLDRQVGEGDMELSGGECQRVALARCLPEKMERIYLTGFSNRGMMVREAAVRYPELFAGCTPWNAPVRNIGAMMKEDSNDMAASLIC